MSKLLYVEPNDEITDLVDRIRRAEGERDLVFVLSPEGKALRSALDVQLLMQYTRGFQKRIALVTPDPKVQALAIRTGFATFPSVAKFEQGEALTAAQALAHPAAISTTRPQPLAPTGPAALPAQPGSQTSVPRRPPEALAAAGAGGSQLGGWWRSANARRWTIGAGAAIFVVGVLAVLLLLPSATLTVGVQAHELTDNVTLQGTVGGNSSVLDVVSTKSLTTPSESGQFTVTPSGTQVLPPTPATGNLYLCWVYQGPKGAAPSSPQPLTFVGNAQPDFEVVGSSIGFSSTNTSQGGTFSVSECPSTSNPQASSSTSDPVAVQANSKSTGTQGNLASGMQWDWTNQPATACLGTAPFCGTNFIIYEANPAAMSGAKNSTNQTIFTSSDVASAQQQEQQIAATEQAKAEQDLKTQAGSGVIAQDSGGNGIQLTTKDPVLPTVGQAGSAETLTVSVTGSATSYTQAAARAAVLADLKSKVPSDGELLADPKLGNIQVVAAAPGGTLTLSSNAVGYWAPTLDLSPYRSKVTFMSPGAARSFLLAQLPGASTVTVHQSPFGLPWLPLLSSRIQILRESLGGSSSTG
jgi:hypothetical protein